MRTDESSNDLNVEIFLLYLSLENAFNGNLTERLFPRLELYALCFATAFVRIEGKSPKPFIVIFTSGQTLEAATFLLFYDYWKVFIGVTW